ncbi:MAG: TonB-dependent receptor plug domain-containing protein [Calditrichales bacterium]|nr:TonB-dependent receptor plug domain-containing protein [Calditrichales bacterium]
MKYFIRISFLILFLIQIVFAQTGDINGTVKDGNSNLYIKDVIVKIDGSDWSTKTNTAGSYSLKGVDPGEYYLVFIKSGYYSLIIPEVKVKAGHSALVEVEMVAGDEKEFLFLQIGGIQVTADRELLSEEAETVHRISSGEIEHMQANSLADVLNMIPGNETTEKMGLQRKQNVAIRNFDSPEDRAAQFGTKIIIDDVPLSNNADLQTGVGVNYGTKVQSTSNLQYDLREVVAENLEKVEVMSGASSVEYGDHSQGLILVQTRTSNVPTRLKIKTNPDTREANLMGSFYSFKTNFIYNLNYGFSERNIRVKGDEYHRISGSMKTVNDFPDQKLKLTQKLKYSRKIEEDDDESDPYCKKAYNRDHHIT